MSEGLPEEIRGNPEFQKHGNLESLAKEYVNMIPTIGRKGVLLPEAGNLEDNARFWTEMGRPATPADYEVTKNFQPPEGLPWDDANAMHMLKLCHDAGCTDAQMNVLLPGYTRINNEAFDQVVMDSQANYQQTQKLMEQELGHTYKSQINLAQRTMEHLFGDDAELLLTARLSDGTLVGNHPIFIKGIIKAASGIGEDQLPVDSAVSRAGGNAMTPEAAKMEIDRLMADTEFNEAYLTAGHVDHVAAQARMDELYAYRGSYGATVNVAGTAMTGKTSQ